MNKDERIKHLENEINRLKEREKALSHNCEIFKQIFEHLTKQFEELKKEINRK